MSLSALARAIAESPTLSLNETARALREKGEAVIHLGGGEPKNKAPRSAAQACAAKLESGDVKYTPTSGVPALKQAIVRYTAENYGWTVGPGNVIVCDGAKGALFNVLFALLDPGDEVVVLAPYWVSYPEMIKMVRGVPVIVRPPEGGFIPRLQDIAAAVSPKTKAVIVNSPNNPSGAVYPEALIAGLVRLCEERGLAYISDDIYHKLVFDGTVPASPYKSTDRDPESTKIISINGISKLYGMTGFRIGWAVAPQAVVKVLANIQAQTVSCTSGLLQAAAVGALNGPATDLEALRAALQGNRDVMLRELASIPGLKVSRPAGTFYCLPDFRAYSEDSAALARLLLEKALVVTVPGNEFGMEGHLRLSYCTTAQDITEGVARIRWALDPKAPKEIRIGTKTVVRDWL
ncbi:MAG: pyridoxal phosphate-dependent aminotransferase [Elusimicrobia bacterium]|nr:pyridoxal phosphate-dependent aminotransferase [Elusimicrobiota bacterium]